VVGAGGAGVVTGPSGALLGGAVLAGVTGVVGGAVWAWAMPPGAIEAAMSNSAPTMAGRAEAGFPRRVTTRRNTFTPRPLELRRSLLSG
jgi:hypothetical protein